MNHHKLRNAFFLILTASSAWTVHAQEIRCYFSPDGGCAAAIIAELTAAQKTIDITAYQLREPNLGAAIINAQQRGIQCRVVIDPEEQSEYAKAAAAVAAAGVPTRADHHEKMMHSKYAIIDNTTVITGSYNWSGNAERRNAENLVIIHDATTATQFTADFAKHWAHSAQYQRTTPKAKTHRNAAAATLPNRNRPQRKEP